MDGGEVGAIPLTLLNLSESPRAGSEARAARQRQLANSLAELGIAPAEASLFHVLHLGLTLPPAHVIPRAASGDYSLGYHLSVGECSAALTACLNKGWLQVIDEPALARIADDLRLAQFLGPIYGYPRVGGVDFAAAGAELWLRLCGRCFRDPLAIPFAYTDVVCQKTAHYYRSLAASLAGVEKARTEEDVVSVSRPSPTGPWRAQWWRRFPQGYRIDVEERRQWQGGCGGGEYCYLEPSLEKRNPFRLRDILDRHNLSLAEWLVLAQMEHGRFYDWAANLYRDAAKSSQGQLGIVVSEEECREGLEACLRYGWLRTLDRQVIDEVHALLQNDQALLAIPRTAEIGPEGRCYDLDDSGKVLVPMPKPPKSRRGRIDFSQVGATLYRMISAEWLGPDWEDDLHVSNTYCWEEHRYCESEAGFELIANEYTAEGNIIRASRVIPIGPWCVYWWERFPAGYRFELELSSS